MKRKILLVDDKSELRRLLSIYLSGQFDVSTAASGLEALQMLENGYTPELIVTDLNMPDVDGKTLVNQLKSSGFFKAIPIIVLSSESQSKNKIELIESGVDDYLIKPFNPLELLVRINKCLKKDSVKN